MNNGTTLVLAKLWNSSGLLMLILNSLTNFLSCTRVRLQRSHFTKHTVKCVRRLHQTLYWSKRENILVNEPPNATAFDFLHLLLRVKSQNIFLSLPKGWRHICLCFSTLNGWRNTIEESLRFCFRWRLCKWSLKCVWTCMCICVCAVAKPVFKRRGTGSRRAVPLLFEP